MLSIVLTALYVRARGAPPMARYRSGARTPSAKFSATVSTVAFVTPSSLSSLVSLPTILPTAFRAATSLSCFDSKPSVASNLLIPCEVSSSGFFFVLLALPVKHL